MAMSHTDLYWDGKPFERPIADEEGREPGTRLIRFKVKRIVEADIIVQVDNATRAEAEAHASRWIEENPGALEAVEFEGSRIETYYGFEVEDGQPIARMNMDDVWASRRARWEERRGK
jgi:hypothetical protein